MSLRNLFWHSINGEFKHIYPDECAIEADRMHDFVMSTHRSLVEGIKNIFCKIKVK